MLLNPKFKSYFLTVPKKIKEALNEAVKGFEASDDMKKRIAENITKVENEMLVEKDAK